MSKHAKGPFTVLSTRSVYQNRWIAVREDRVVRPGGDEGIFGVINIKAGSSVLAVNGCREAYLVREFKYAIERDSIESMSGAIETGESPLDAAKRELREELGLEAKKWFDLGKVDPFTTVLNSPNYMFLALETSESTPCPDDGEILRVVRVPFQEAVRMVMDGEITHSASCVLILKAEKLLRVEWGK